MIGIQTLTACVVGCWVVSALAAEPAPTKEGLEFFEKSIRPVLVERCYKCHSEGEKVKGKLRLDSREGMLRGGENGPAIVPGDPAKSLLITAIKYSHEELQMPPKEPLNRAEVAAFEVWVKMGAPDPRVPGAAGAIVTAPAGDRYDYAKWRQFWSFVPVKAQAVPVV